MKEEKRGNKFDNGEVSYDLLPLIRILELYGVDIVEVKDKEQPEVSVRFGQKWSGNIITKPSRRLKGLTLRIVLYLLRRF